MRSAGRGVSEELGVAGEWRSGGLLVSEECRGGGGGE